MDPVLMIAGEASSLRDEVVTLLSRHYEVQNWYSLERSAQFGPSQLLVAVGLSEDSLAAQEAFPSGCFPSLFVLPIEEKGRMQELFDAGWDEVVSEPIREDELIARLEQVVRRWTLRCHDQQLIETLKARSEHDPLTQLLNRYGLEQQAMRIVSESRRTRAPVSLLLLDMDHYKTVNDRFGHQVGDQVLVTFGELLTQHLRQHDIVSRFGGDEFVVVLPHTSSRQAICVAEKILEALERNPAQIEGMEIAIEVSLGIASALPADSALPGPEEFGRLLAMADQALYKAKARGGKSYELAQPIGVG